MRDDGRVLANEQAGGRPASGERVLSQQLLQLISIVTPIPSEIAYTENRET
jgi:hypothetical protein